MALEANKALARNVGFFRPSAADEELELTKPLRDADLHDEDSDAAQLQESGPVLIEAENTQETQNAQASDDLNDVPFDFDDDDDINDFDDLGDFGVGPSSTLPAKTSFFPEFDLNDMAAAQGREAPPAPPAELVEDTAEQNEIPDPAPPSFDQPDVEPIADTDELDDPPNDLNEASPEPLLEEPVLQKASRSLRSEEAVDLPRLALEEAPIAPLDTSLSLQPIPELQSEPAPPIAASRKMESDDGEAANRFGDSPEADDDDDDFGASQTELAPTEIDMLDLEGLEIDPLELETPDQADDQIAEDWHAQMADVLAENNDLDEDAQPETEANTEPQEQIEPSTTVLPLSKTLTQLAATGEPNVEREPLVPTFLTRMTRQKAAAGQPPSTSPADVTELSPSQLPLGVIANVPRLRRFAAVQIGDELVADQLVQSVIETTLADPSLLQHSADLGLALITILHQQRQRMLKGASAPELSPESARTFEMALCRGLAGADQFEIHQFAQAINGLDERDRGLLVLVALENLTYDQVAAVIQVPTEQVMSLVAGARMHLRQALATDDQAADVSSSAIGFPHAQEIEIHGYLDGELDGRHMADVDALVEYDEDAADRLLHYGIQGDLIRRLYAPLLNRPISGKMLDALSSAARPARRGFGFSARKALTAGAFMIALGGGAPSHAPPPDGLASVLTTTAPSIEGQAFQTVFVRN